MGCGGESCTAQRRTNWSASCPNGCLARPRPALIWVGLQSAHLGAAEAPLYVLVGLVLAAWIPMAGAGITAAWAADINTALAWAGTWYYREGYADGAVDMLTLDDL